MQNRLNTVKENKETLQQQLAELRAAIKAEQQARPDSVGINFFCLVQLPSYSVKDFTHGIFVAAMEPQEERTSALSQLTQRKKELSTLEEELAAFGASDPAKLEEKKRAVFLAKEAAIRWTGEHR